VPFEVIRDRFVIGSFQRDSLGADLGRAKWQKDPALLVDLVARLPADDVLLLLAGPRRHWVIEECRRRSVPYLFVGEDAEPGRDDIEVNTLSLERMGALWNLIDLYVVPSKAEGGPKALLEAGLTETPIISTPVGMASDLLPEALLFSDAGEGAALVHRIRDGRADAAYAQFFGEVRRVNSFDAFRARVDEAVAAAATETDRR
jgi:glycosyltransferase involved in cell wall biosynthesis